MEYIQQGQEGVDDDGAVDDGPGHGITECVLCPEAALSMAIPDVLISKSPSLDPSRLSPRETQMNNRSSPNPSSEIRPPLNQLNSTPTPTPTHPPSPPLITGTHPPPPLTSQDLNSN